MKTKELLARLLNQPTAPFRERFVLQEITRILERSRIPYFVDGGGNLIAGVKRVSQLKGRMLFMAHADHPGFQVSRKLGKGRYEGRWHGGLNRQQLRHCSIRAFSLKGRADRGIVGRVTRVGVTDPKRSSEGIRFEFRCRQDLNLTDEWFGTFDFPGFRLRGDQITTRAADDLAGCVIALQTLLKNRKRSVALFTRAEEVGFVGCLHLLERKILRPRMWVVSLEASKTLPGAEIGKGPVLRLGDRMTLFNSQFSMHQWEVAQKLATRAKKFLFQRRIMEGGSCEASALNLYGINAIGISLPLGNYHNIGLKKAQPEIISLRDVENAVKLCSAMAQAGPPDPKLNAHFKKRLVARYRSYLPRLRVVTGA